MPYTLILHIVNTDPVVGEVDELPSPTDSLVAISNPRMRDGTDVEYLAENITIVYYPVDRINFIEVITGVEDEEIIGFVRE
ncbi:MAG: hypothetical protein KAS38_03295 [Anaerolineales bacterium]|jgi:hypothetical protein|nr:hypothetical protein [Anaerolineales bacterium]MCK4977357.1 hypothetical protein [Anaerolineales bacterium]MCK5430748.1 hypothetical protein [Anaerolineales bacterium]